MWGSIPAKGLKIVFSSFIRHVNQMGPRESSQQVMAELLVDF